jgi:L-fuconolactonase
LPAAIETARNHPATTFVLDHVAKRPPTGESWSEGVAALSELPNVVCKLSGVLTESQPADTVAFALACFGHDRCMFGSDWPVCLLAASYGETLTIVGGDEDVLARTAIRTYGLDIRRH